MVISRFYCVIKNRLKEQPFPLKSQEKDKRKMRSISQKRRRLETVKGFNTVFLILGIIAIVIVVIFGFITGGIVFVLRGLIMIIPVLFGYLLLGMLTDIAECMYSSCKSTDITNEEKVQNIFPQSDSDLTSANYLYARGLTLYKEGRIDEGLSLIKEAADNSSEYAKEFLQKRSKQIEAERRK